MLFCKNKESKTPCPHCHKNLPYKCISYSFWHGAIDELHCPHCNTIIKPEKDVINFWQGFGISFFSVVAAGKLYVKFIDDDYIESFIAVALGCIIALFFVFFYTAKNIKYIEV